ncbi:MAG: 1-deoxy-D-xylulose-5-phosphate reductoisomerase, partial [Kiritimatiellia bacterium]|nr:1-deoxy-D-xylulose-5-phosphate reductoisomerase [Kiritimatiellia bacterium]
MKLSKGKPSQPRKKVVILGSTGSIGENVLRVVERFPDRFQIIGLAAQRRAERLFQQARQFKIKHVAIAEPDTAQRYKKLAPAGVSVLQGKEGLEELASLEADIVVAAVVGMAGLKP